MLLARRLVESGVTFVTVNAGGWDTHANNFEALKSKKLPEFDRAGPASCRTSTVGAWTRTTLVLVWGEFGRTPRVNKDAGRDHWPGAQSVVLSGGGLKMGQAIGSTDAKAELPRDRPLTPEDVLATMYHHLGIDTETGVPQRSPAPPQDPQRRRTDQGTPGMRRGHSKVIDGVKTLLLLVPTVLRGNAVLDAPRRPAGRGASQTAFPRRAWKRGGTFSVLIALALVTFANLAVAQLPSSRLNNIFPGGARQGASVDCTIGGADLDEVSGLYFSHPGIKGELTGPNKFRVTIASDVPPGPYDVRAVTSRGLSNFRAFSVGDRPEIVEQEPNDEPSKAVRSPVAGDHQWSNRQA